MGSKSIASSNKTLSSLLTSLGLVRGSSILYSMLSKLCEPLMDAETPLTVIIVGPTWLCLPCMGFEPAMAACLAKAAARADRWLRWLWWLWWLTDSEMSLPLPVVDEPASLDVSLPCLFHNSSASCKISAK